MKTKETLRAELAERLRGMPQSLRDREAASLRARLAAAPLLVKAPAVGVFIPLPDEPDLTELYETWLSTEKRLAIPVFEKPTGWRFHWVRALDHFQRGTLGLPLPPTSGPAPPKTLDAVLVPGRGFTITGHRIGRGGGVYDRLLADLSVRSIGIAFGCQRVGHLPRDPHDVPLDQVLFGDES